MDLILPIVTVALFTALILSLAKLATLDPLEREPEPEPEPEEADWQWPRKAS